MQIIYRKYVIPTWYHSKMCYPIISIVENSSKDVFDLLIFEPERDEVETTLRNINQAFTNAFVQSEATNFNEAYLDFIEEFEIQTILRGDY